MTHNAFDNAMVVWVFSIILFSVAYAAFSLKCFLMSKGKNYPRHRLFMGDLKVILNFLDKENCMDGVKPYLIFLGCTGALVLTVFGFMLWKAVSHSH